MLALNQLYRCASNPSTIQILREQSIIDSVLECFLSKDIGIADKAAQTIIQLAKNPVGLETIFHSSVLTHMEKAFQINSTIRFRVLDTFISIAVTSKEAFHLTEKTNHLQSLIDTIKSDDLLEQLNALELIDKLSTTPEGLAYLEGNGVLSKLTTLLTTEDPFLIPRVVAFMGKIGVRGDVAVIQKYDVVTKLRKLLEEGSPEVQEAVMTAFGEIGSTNEGLSLLSQQKVFDEWLSFIFSENRRNCCLHTFATLLKNISKSPSIESTEILKRVTNEIEDRNRTKQNIMNILMTFLRHPFVELRYAVLDVLCGLAMHSWGLEKLLEWPGFYEFATNRDSETTKPGKEWKYTLIQSMFESAKRFPTTVERSKQSEMTRYLQRGVFWKEAESNVAIHTEHN
eukprot:TRINITY_DN3624_c0_g1_i2.p1 TRINITY_DN3624_c0_g1~~TRINITY_DN3624_c0_g1_i2.p1  ORF type:complete len:398 (+),score=76.55 TRINITY_DN3624_c0_g1_i2:84-1277(+)